MGEKYTAIDGHLLKGMLAAGCQFLENRKKEVDALNVFPVPDGDTGTNMLLTFTSAVKSAQQVTGNSIGDVAGAASMGSLMGARGNSGVILSRIMRGFAKGLENLQEADAEQVARALQMGVETAYKAVMRPVEGTILTVSRELAKGAMTKAKSGETDVGLVIRAGYGKGEQALKRTPELLPVLKQAGVVDAGGFGFLILIDGWMAYLERGELFAGQEGLTPVSYGETPGPDQIFPAGITEIIDLNYPYCTELLIRGRNLDEEAIQQALADKGDCLLAVGTSEIIKIHIHTANPGQILEYAVGLGSLHEVHIQNMLSQNEAAAHVNKHDKERSADGALPAYLSAYEDSGEPVASASGSPAGDNLSAVNGPDASPLERVPYGMVAVAMGDGIAETFRGLGADQIIFGGQTMNPSTLDLVEAVRKIPADNVFIFPNNKNVIMAASQVADLVTDQKVRIVPTKSIPQGIAAMIEFNPALGPAQNEEAMTQVLAQVGSGEVTFAVRDSQYKDITIKDGDILGLVEGDIATIGSGILEVAQKVLEKMDWRQKSLVTIFTGQDTPPEDVEALEAWLREEGRDAEFEIYAGRQPLYYFIIGVE